MRLSLLASLLVLSILISEAQGIRLKKGIVSAGHHKIHENNLIKTSNGGLGEVILCKVGHCSGNNIRKLMTKITSSTITTSKNDKNGGSTKAHDTISKGKLSSEELSGEEEKFSVDHSPVSEHREVAPERYPDIFDLAGMDYSSAKRKPPIHN
ncbi:hypothetical protein F0562_009354 [Nyssa sinensis]|uniref:Uncharacterized protein n=1 Tax=Nyssa sinensis TaxID=561372 RepID=A0A5J5A0P7_9ASTE|nr:hypothetical protein F0562_009354 [Nyssa sinensis]